MYNADMQDRLLQSMHYLADGLHKDTLRFIVKAMVAYLKKRPKGKAFHDPLAACCAIDPGIGTWKEVELYREKGEWGSRLCEGSGTHILIDYDHERFLHVLSGGGPEDA